MNFVNTTILTSISTFIKLVSGFIIGKLVAIFIGPSGLGIVGQFQSFMQMVSHLSSGAITQGIIKYTSEFKNQPKELRKFLGTAVRISLCTSVLSSILLFFFHKSISLFIFETEEYSSIILFLSFTLIFYVLNNFILSTLNGLREIKVITIINIIGSLINLVLTSLLVYYLQLKGALIALITNQTLIFFLSFFFLLKSKQIGVKFFNKRFSKFYFSKLSKFILMTIIGALLTPFVQMQFRFSIAELLSWKEVGYWEGLIKISSYNMVFVTSSLGLYYMPKLSELKTNFELRKEIFSTSKVLIPFITFLCVGIYLTRNLIILVLFTEEFLPMRNLFFFHLLGDIFKSTSYLMIYLMWAKAMTKMYIISEVCFFGLYLVLGLFLLKRVGVVGITYAYCIAYFFYLIILIFLFRNILFSRFNHKE